MSRSSPPFVDLSTLAIQGPDGEDRSLELLTILDLVPDAVIAARRDGTIVFASRRTEEVFGYERSELLNQPVEILLPERFRDPHREQRDGFFGSPRDRSMGSDLDLRGRRKDGSEFPADISLSPVRLGSEEFVIASVRDISERRMLVARLESTLTEVLDGFIPICSNCKSIRQPDESWVRLERYLAEHSQASFSHSICPLCEDVLYPEDGEGE
jgi:PAS domain S-box-containing protein